MNEKLIAEVVRRVVDEVHARQEAGWSAPGPAIPVNPAARGTGTTPATPVAPVAPATAGLPAPWPPRRVAVGADHGGYERKEQLKSWLAAAGYEVDDCGTSGPESVDYPDFAVAVARRVAGGRCQAGIVVDGAGIGSAMAANKVSGVRCAVCWSVESVLNAREHNDANVLSLGSGFVPFPLARRMAELFLKTENGGGRHLRRVAKIAELDR